MKVDNGHSENTITDPVTGRVRGALYSNPFDCLWKTFKTEGIAGWYKGTHGPPFSLLARR